MPLGTWCCPRWLAWSHRIVAPTVGMRVAMCPCTRPQRHLPYRPRYIVPCVSFLVSVVVCVQLKPRVDAVNDVVHSAQEKQRLLSAAEQRVAFLESELASAASQLTTSQAERNNLREKLQDCNVELEQSRTRVAMLISDTEGYRESERRAQAALMEAHSQIQALQQDIDNMRKDADGLVAQR